MTDEKPILVNGPMVRAILSGAQCQTRRVIRNVTYESFEGESGPVACVKDWDGGPSRLDMMQTGEEGCARYHVGDRIWVRETWRIDDWNEGEDAGVLYRANYTNPSGKWRPSIHMPKWATRLWLEVTGVRAQRVQKITHGDIAAEGVACPGDCLGGCFERFVALWDSINAQRGYGWDTNPWVWVYELKRMEEKP